MFANRSLCHAVRKMALFASAAWCIGFCSSNAAEIPIGPINSPYSRLITLGTAAGPNVYKDRSEAASLIQIGDKFYLIDCGDGTNRRLAVAGIAPSQINSLFITHLHFDHVGGFAPLLGFAWFHKRAAGKRDQMVVYGPPGTSQFVDDAAKYLSIPEGIFVKEMPPGASSRDLVDAHDVDTGLPKIILDDGQVRVTAVENSHFITIHDAERPLGAKRSYAYRFDMKDRSIVFSGDTGPSEELTKLATGADILVTEVMDRKIAYENVRRRFSGNAEQLEAQIAHFAKEHISPEEIGDMAQRAGVKMVVLSHIGPGWDSETDMRHYSDGVRAHYKGIVKVARDGDEY
jgi:ribonuclease BN (tRNA processing enzyme)